MIVFLSLFDSSSFLYLVREALNAKHIYVENMTRTAKHFILSLSFSAGAHVEFGDAETRKI